MERLALHVAGDHSQSVSQFFRDYLHDLKPFDVENILAQTGKGWVERSDHFPTGPLALATLTVQTDANGQLSLGPAGTPKPGSLTLPGYGLTLSAGAQGYLELAATAAWT